MKILKVPDSQIWKNLTVDCVHCKCTLEVAKEDITLRVESRGDQRDSWTEFKYGFTCINCQSLNGVADELIPLKMQKEMITRHNQNYTGYKD